MARALSHTPPGRVFAEGDEPALRVARRRVLFVPGYDPEGGTRYRMLFVRELIRHGKRFGLTRREISKAETLPDLPGQRWRVGLSARDWSTDTTYEVLRWDDIVVKDLARSIWFAMAVHYAGLLYALVTGMIARFFRLHWKFGGVILYPATAIAAMLLVALGLGWASASLLGWAAGPLPAPSGQIVALAVAALAMVAIRPIGKRGYLWHLTHDWNFNWQHGMGWRPDYDERVERFARHLVEAAREGGVDELLVVGHSSGSTFAVEIMGRALELDPDLPKRVRTSLLTVGTCVPLVALNPAARVYRTRMARLMRCRDLFWAEYQAPQDWLNFIGFAPIRDVRTDVAPAECANPSVRSSLFSRTVAEKTYRQIVWQPFRMHFQFLIANDHLGEYDYLMIVGGPLTLEDRVRLGERSGPLVLGEGAGAAESVPESRVGS